MENETEIERVPCPDDMCTGVIGAEGRCGTCGRALAPGEIPPAADAPPLAEAPVATDVAPAPAPIVAPDETADRAEFDRVPCPDDMCTGIIGLAGRCGTCGRAA